MKRLLRLGATLLAAALLTSGAAAQLPDPHAGVAMDGEAGEPGAADELQPDGTAPAADVAPGTIEALILDDKDRPIPSRGVRLTILRQSIAEGNTTSERQGTTDATGMVRWSGLTRGMQLSYRVTVTEGPAKYASQPFNLQPEAGQRVVLHVYPVTRDIQQASVGVRGVLYIEPRDDVFQIEVMYRIVNVGRTTWVPANTTLRLPPGNKGFTAGEESDLKFLKSGDDEVRLEGSVTPGEHDVNFRYQVPNELTSSARFSMTMLPHVAELRVMSESARGMQLEVADFPPSEPATNQRGQRILVTGRQLRTLSEPPLDRVEVTLSGIPTPGAGRWVAAIGALSIALAGLFSVWSKRSGKHPGSADLRDVQRARELLLEELVALERAKVAGEIGPQTYDAAKRAISDALVRIEDRAARGEGSGPYRGTQNAA